MAARTYRVVFEPAGRTVAVAEGRTLLEAARDAGVHLNAPCGGAGTCGGCRVHIPDSPPEPSETCRRILTGEEIRRHLRLACQVRVRRDLRVVIPAETALGDQKILTEGAGRDVPLDPNVRKVVVRVPAPSVHDQRSDAGRLRDALAEAGEADVELDLRTLRDLPKDLRKLDFHAAAVLVGRRLVDLDRPVRADACYGIAFDVGTTTVVGYLVDLLTGRTVGVASRTNPQTAYGDDVVARIEHCGNERTGLRTLRKLAAEALNGIVREACAAAQIPAALVYEATVVGNTTMVHLLLGLPVDAIGRAPFVAATLGAQDVAARDVGLKINRRGRVYTAPLVGGFVGADTVAVALAAGLHESDGLVMAIDVGTNGEIVLGTRERLLACSTAAGPAFEGARIRYGMRAATGAIDRVEADADRLALHTIDDAPPVGLCGTGLIEAVAALRATGVLEPTGALRPADALAADRPALARRIIGADGETAFVLATKAESGADHPILLTQRDVREVQLAKAALAAGAATLLADFGAEPADLDAVLLAGAFGNHIRPDRARAVGLIPDVPLERLRFVGNAAGAGARMLLANRPLRVTAEDVARGIEHVELSGRADFMERFTDAMFFPAT